MANEQAHEAAAAGTAGSVGTAGCFGTVCGTAASALTLGSLGCAGAMALDPSGTVGCSCAGSSACVGSISAVSTQLSGGSFGLARGVPMAVNQSFQRIPGLEAGTEESAPQAAARPIATMPTTACACVGSIASFQAAARATPVQFGGASDQALAAAGCVGSLGSVACVACICGCAGSFGTAGTLGSAIAKAGDPATFESGQARS